MKTINAKSILVMSLICLAQMGYAQNNLTMPAMADTEYQAKAQKWLTHKTTQVKTLKNGVQIKAVSKETVDKAVNSLGGKATVDYGNGQTLKINSKTRAENGVHVGSGGNSITATSSVDQKGQLVVRPPSVIPETSITVVGRWGKSQENMEICAVGYETDEKGQIILKQSLAFIIPANPCAKLNKPLRVLPGTYKIFFKSPTALFHSPKLPNQVSMMVSVTKGENRVIPLRELTVPNSSNETDGKIEFEVSSDMSSATELRKALLDAFYTNTSSLSGLKIQYNLTGLIHQVKDVEELVKVCNEPEHLKARKNGLCFGSPDFDYAQDFAAQGGDFVSLFPGTYKINWNIDDQRITTDGIVIE